MKAVVTLNIKQPAPFASFLALAFSRLLNVGFSLLLNLIVQSTAQKLVPRFKSVFMSKLLLLHERTNMLCDCFVGFYGIIRKLFFQTFLHVAHIVCLFYPVKNVKRVHITKIYKKKENLLCMTW